MVTQFQKPAPKDVARLAAIGKALEAFTGLSHQFPVTSARVLLAVASSPGKSVNEYAADIGLSQSTISMTLTKLGVRKPGSLGLIDLEIDPTNYARRRVHLTTRGKAVVSEALAGLSGLGK